MSFIETLHNNILEFKLDVIVPWHDFGHLQKRSIFPMERNVKIIARKQTVADSKIGHYHSFLLVSIFFVMLL